MPGFFRLENRLKTLISENEYFRQEIDVVQRHGSFSVRFRPHITKNIPILEEKVKTTLPECSR